MTEPDKKDKLIADLSRKVIFLSLVGIVLLVILLVVYFKKNEEPKSEETGFFCGNATEEKSTRYTDKLSDGSMFDSEKGEKLFKQNCAVCHSLGSNMITGRGLRNVMSRVPSSEWLEKFIMNSDSMAKAGDPYTLKIREGNTDHMTSFKNQLSRNDVLQIIDYIKGY